MKRRSWPVGIMALALLFLSPSFLGPGPRDPQPFPTKLEKEAERREFGQQVVRDVAVWMVLAFATAGTDWAPYLIYAGAASVVFAVCYQIYMAVKR